ncbi:MAG: hypothetical protein RR585_13660 [Coprobacillus sp.]
MNKEVECPYCYAVYDVEKLDDSQFECICESTIQVDFNEGGEPYLSGN